MFSEVRQRRAHKIQVCGAGDLERVHEDVGEDVDCRDGYFGEAEPTTLLVIPDIRFIG